MMSIVIVVLLFVTCTFTVGMKTNKKLIKKYNIIMSFIQHTYQ